MKQLFQTDQAQSRLSVLWCCSQKSDFLGLLLVSIAVLSLWLANPFVANALTQRHFQSPEQAVERLLAAARADDKDALVALFGPDADVLISSGDPVADQRGRERFVKACEQKIELEIVDASQQILIIGERNYPFPIPLVRQNDGWSFDTAAGMDELLNRRIGRNELHTIKVMRAYTEAQREYAAITRDDGVAVFARYLASHQGERDGLYWPQQEDAPESPFGPLIAKATAKGYHAGEQDGFADPFYGYYYTILTAQGDHADGGAFDYIVDDKMVLGFALLAYPARYGASGIMTFMVNQEGAIYEKDLGEDTAGLASQISLFDPDPSWQHYQDTSEK